LTPTLPAGPLDSPKMTIKTDDKQHRAYSKKKAGEYKEPRAPTAEEVAAAQAREVAEKRAAKAHVSLAAINRGDLGEGNREAEQAQADAELARKKLEKKEARAEKRVARKEARAAKKSSKEEDSADFASLPPAKKADDTYLGGFFRSLSSLVGVEA